MEKIAVVTDSTAYIPEQVKKGLPIFTIPLHVNLGGKTYDDGVDLQPQEFYERIKTEKEIPQTSQATPSEIFNFYKNLLEQGYKIISIHLSEKLSSTLDAAKIAKKELSSAKIELVDSQTAAAALAFHVVEAAKAVVAGASLGEVKALAENMRQHTHIYFIPGSLEFLQRGGRIGGAAAFLGSILQIKPLLENHDGIIDAVEKVRTMSRAMSRLIDLVEKKVGDSSDIHLAGLYADIPEMADQIVTLAIERLGIERIKDSFITTISPVLGTHIGPGSVGLAYMYGVS
ncbi:MAG: DegV family protein [Anaerolineaceae bacterium]